MNTNKKATGSSSKRLLAALAVLAVAFVVLAAVPAVATDSDAAPTATSGLTGSYDVATYDDLNAVLTDTSYSAATGVRLTADITLVERIIIGKTITIDLNGHTLTKSVAKDEYDGNDATKMDRIFTIDPNADVTIKDSSSAKTGKLVGYINPSQTDSSGDAIDYSGSSVIRVGGSSGSVAKLTLDGIAIEATAYGIYAANYSEVVIKDSTINAGLASAISGNGTQSEASVSINGGTYASEKNVAIFWPSSTTLTVKDATLKGVGGLDIRGSATVTLTDVAIELSAAAAGVGTQGPASFNVGVGIYANDSTSYGDPTVTIQNVTVATSNGVKSSADVYYGFLNRSAGTTDFETAITAPASGTAAHYGNLTIKNDNGDELFVFSASSANYTSVRMSVDGDQLTITGDSVITNANLKVESGADLVIADDTQLTLSTASALTLKSTVSLKTVSGLVQAVAGAVVDSDDRAIYIDGTMYSANKALYKLHSLKVGDTAVYYGIGVQPITYTGSAIKDTDLTPIWTVIAGGTGVTMSFTNFTVENTDCIEPGYYDNVVKAQIQAAKGNDGASVYAYADLEITKVELTADMVTVDKLTYTGSALTPVFTIGTSGLTLDQSEVTIVYEDGTGGSLVTNADGTKSIVTVGKYKATITVKSTSSHFQGSAILNDKVVVYKATPTVDIELNDTWNSEDYYAEDVTYDVTLNGGKVPNRDTLTITVAASLATTISDGETVLNTSTASGVKYQTATISNQAALDAFIMQWSYSADVKNDAGFTFYLQITTSNGNNLNAASSDILEIEVGKFVNLSDYVKFSSTTVDTTNNNYIDLDEDNLIAKEKGATEVDVTGTLTKTSGKYTFVLTFQSTTDRYVLTTAGTSLTSDNSKVTFSDLTASSGVLTTTVTVSTGLSVDAKLTLVVEGNTDKGCDPVTYVIDLSGIAPAAFSVKFVEDGYTTVVYQNSDASATQTYDVDLKAGYYLDVPATASSSYWTMNGVKYNGGSIYVIAAKDIKNEVITFTAAGSSVAPVDPSKDTYTVFFILDGKQTSETYTAGAVVEFPATENVAWTCNGVAVDVSEGITATADVVYIGTTASEVPTYSTDLAVSAKLVDGKFRFVIAGYDGGDIKEGGVSITYTYKPASGGRNVTATIDASQITVEYDGTIAYGVVDMPAGQDVIRFTATYTYELDGTSYSESSSTVYVGA